MNSIDLAILGIMALSCLIGIIRGMTKEVLSLFTWVGSVVAAYMLYPQASGIARGHIANPMIADGITGVALFLIFLVAFGIITVIISNSIRESMMGGLDRSLGFAFGIFRGVFVVCVIEIVCSMFISRDKQSETVQQARFIAMVRNGSDEIVGMLPLDMRNAILIQTQRVQGIAPMSGDLQDLINQQNPISQPSSPSSPPDFMEQLATQPKKNQTRVPSSHQDPQKTTEGLASLKPQATQLKSEGVYDSRQQRALERLIETSE